MRATSRSIRIPSGLHRCPTGFFRDFRRNRDSGPGPDRTPLRSLRSRACSRGSDKRVPVAETWVKPNGEARPQRTSPYRPYDYQHIRLSEAKSPTARKTRGRIDSECATGSSSMVGGCKNSARLMLYCTGLRVPDMSGFPVWSPLQRGTPCSLIGYATCGRKSRLTDIGNPKTSIRPRKHIIT